MRTAPFRRQVILVVATLVLLGQAALGLGAAPRMRVLQLDTLLGGVPICHAEAADDRGSQDKAPPLQHDLDCALCAVCHLGAVAALPGPALGPFVPPVPMAASGVALPPARAPPVPVLLAAAYPTGPPVLA